MGWHEGRATPGRLFERHPVVLLLLPRVCPPPRSWQFPASLCSLWNKTITAVLLVFHHAPARLLCRPSAWLLHAAVSILHRKTLRKWGPRVRPGFPSNELQISKPTLQKISVALNVPASTALLLWLTKFPPHLHKNCSHFFDCSYTSVISLPFHSPYHRNTELRSWTSVNKTWTSGNKTYPCM